VPASSPATQALDLLSISYRLFEHASPPASLEQAARQREQSPGQVIRCILFRCGKDHFVLTLTAGPGQLSWRKLRAHLEVSRISMATRDEVLAVSGYEVGTVSPFGLSLPIRTLVDERVFLPE
jgi:Cys-tRNA(Pro)/Cys-tRNA(Cys) deacylase